MWLARVQVRSFYAESRLLTNEKIKRELGITLLYPTCKTRAVHKHRHTHRNRNTD
eukprot:COSAG03_NODE_14791_length_452_cov_0.719547_1_plen_54_part_10